MNSSPPTDPPPRRLHRSARALVALLLLGLFLKWMVVDGFEVRGNSMQPVLRDVAGAPDHIAVFKRHFDLFEPERFDLVVFEGEGVAAASPHSGELSGDRYVKRIVGLGGDELVIRGGDLHRFDPATGEPALLHRPLARVLDMLVPVAAWPSAAAPPSNDAEWILPPPPAAEVPALAPTAGPPALVLASAAAGSGDAMVHYAAPIHDGFVDADGNAHRGRNAVNDVAISCTVTLLAPGSAARLELREQGDLFAVELSDDAPVALERQRGPTRERLPLPGPAAEALSGRLRPGIAARATFLNVDDRLVLLVDGEPVFEVAYAGNTSVEGKVANEPSFGCARGRVRFAGVCVARDVYYGADGTIGVVTPVRVPEGSFFVLGDNSASSRDSRHFGTVPRERFIGRPFMIFFPLERMRLL